MKLKIYISGKYVYVPAEFAADFIRELNNACIRACAKEQSLGDDLKDFEPLVIELRAE